MAERRHARDIRERGFTVFEGAYSAEAVDRLRGAIVDRIRALDPPRMWSWEMEPMSGNVATNISGVNLWRLLSECPELTDVVLVPEVVEAVREVLGAEARLELVCAAVTDETRPFFPWHYHVGGFDDAVYPKLGGWPDVRTADRVTTVLYLEDTLEDEDGPLLVYPRKVGDSVAPAGDREVEWEGQVEIRVPRGSVVAMEQCTWHAVRKMRRPGYRILVSCLFRTGELPTPAWADPELHQAAEHSPLLASLLPPESERPADAVLPNEVPQGEAAPVPEATVSRMRAEVRARAPAWALDAMRWNHRQLLLELTGPGGNVVVEAAVAEPGVPGFHVLDDVSYSHRGELDLAHADAFRRLLDVLHPLARSLIHPP